MRRVLGWFLKICVALIALYYVGVNAFLASSFAPRLMNIQPQIAQIHYSQAYTLVPFHLVIDDFRLSVQDPNIQLYASADHVEADIYPWTLLANRFFATNINGEGVVFRIRERLEKAKATPAAIAMMPSIPGFESIERDPVVEFIKPLAVELTALNVHNLHQVWVNEFEFEGRIDVTGGFSFEALKSLRLDDTLLNNVKGQLRRAKKNVASVSSMKLTATLDETSLEKVEIDSLLSAVNATVDLKAKISNATFLNAYLRGVPDVHIEEGAGVLSLEMSLEKGVFHEGSALALDTSKVVVELPYVDVVGKSAIRWRVKNGSSWFNVRVPEVVAIQRIDGKKIFTGTNFDLAAATNADLAKMSHVNLDLAIEKGSAGDLSFLNQFVPEGTGLHITSGGGTLTGKLSFSTRTHHAKGSLDIEGNQLSIKNQSATLTGHAKIHGEIVDLNVDSGAMDISGSSIALNDVTVYANGEVQRGFWVKVVADPCTMSPKGAVKWASKLTVNLQNLKPVLSVVSANAPIPGLLLAFADVPNVRVSSDIVVHAKDVEVRKLRLDSSKLQVEGEFKLLESGEVNATAAKLYPWGAVLVKVRGLTAGVDFQGTMVRPILIDPEGWYAKYRTDHPAPSAAASL